MTRRPAYTRAAAAALVAAARARSARVAGPEAPPPRRPIPALTAADGVHEDALPTHTPTPEED